MKMLIILFLSSCLGIYEHTNRLKVDKVAIYKIAIDQDFMNKFLEKKRNEIIRFSEMIRKNHDKLDNCIEKFCNQLQTKNLMGRKSVEKFKLDIKKEIKLLSLHLKRDILNIEILNDSQAALFVDKFSKLIKDNYNKFFNIYKTKDKLKNNLFVKKLEKFLREILYLEHLPFIFYLKNINYINHILQESLDRNLIYDYIVDNNLNKLQNEIFDAEKKALNFLKIAFITVKNEKVFINFEGYVIRRPKLSKTGKKKYEEVPLYLTEAKGSIEDANTFYLKVPGMINLKLKIKDEVVYFEDVALNLMKLN